MKVEFLHEETCTNPLTCQCREQVRMRILKRAVKWMVRDALQALPRMITDAGGNRRMDPEEEAKVARLVEELFERAAKDEFTSVERLLDEMEKR